MNSNFWNEIVKKLASGNYSKDEIARIKRRICKKYNVKNIPTDIEIFLHADKNSTILLKKQLRTKPARSLSGVAVCAIMSSPFRCPHGECLMCPSKTSEGVPQSYTGKEPAAMRGIRNRFDPYLQVMNRLEQYIATGHMPHKVELIIMGGTFPSFSESYQEMFVMYALKAMNDFSKLFFRRSFDIQKFKDFFELPGDIGSPKRTLKIHAKLLKLKGISTLEKEQLKNEKSHIRCIGLTVETRPDYARLSNLNLLLKLGCTRVELGVQSLYDNVLKEIRRGHDVSESIRATRQLKDLGFKINYHMMLGLPKSTQQMDLAMFKQLFTDSRFRPDMLKIYPCMVVKESGLYEVWKKGMFTPLTTQKAACLIASIKKIVPVYCRIMRVQRDIPTNATIAGVDRTNLRQYVQKIMKEQGAKCRCIRCREVGRRKQHGAVFIKALEYTASEGLEFFISAEDLAGSLYGFCRLRFPSQSLRKEIGSRTALIRELHVYGETVPFGEKGDVQHSGIGKGLLYTAEKIAHSFCMGKMVVISGIGAREYYRKLGYRREGPYMIKSL
ncbi:MAG: tRNA uridine(34) 5-carboxymethylaminomethyl modification radical SAM/GNAT enzyme Elp3 [Candidatus Woesearchaeota archaeon]